METNKAEKDVGTDGNVVEQTLLLDQVNNIWPLINFITFVKHNFTDFHRLRLKMVVR